MLERDHVLDVLGRLTTEISGAKTLEDVLLKIVTTLSELLAGAQVSIWQAVEGEAFLSLQAVCPAVDRVFPRQMALGEGVVGRVAQTQQQMAGEQWSEAGGAFVQAGYVVGLGVPLVWQGVLQGALVVADRTLERTFSETDKQSIDLLALQASAALSNARSTARSDELAQMLRDEEGLLLHIQVAIQQMLEEPDVDASLCEVAEALQALGWRHIVVVLFSDEGELGETGAIERLISVGVKPEDEDRYRPHGIPVTMWERFLTRALEHFRIGGLYYVPDGDAGDLAWNAGDVVFAPLRLGQDHVSGIIRLEMPVDGLRPTRETLRAADILASQAAYIVENARLLAATAEAAEILAEQVEELSMMHRADRELGTHLDIRRIMTLTMDWALRRTGAETGLLMLMTDDKRGLVPSVKLGHVDPEKLNYDVHNPLPIHQGIMGRAARTGETQLVRDVTQDSDYISVLPGVCVQLVVPLSMRGEVLGVITLASVKENAFNETDVSFLERLARRAAIALDNARLFRQSEQMADDMAVLYTASRTITSTLEREVVLQRMAQAMTVTLECSSAVIFDYRAESDELQVLAVYRLGTARNAKEVLPEIRQTIALETFPALQMAIEQQHPLVLRTVDPVLSELDRQHLSADGIHAMVLTPLVAQGELIGLAAVIEGRRDRIFTSNDVFKAETLASQASVALRQSLLFSEVFELEKIKSEMIRMASHDLRNPLNNIMGYVELLAMSLDQDGVTPDQAQYITNLRRSTQLMRSLLEDLLTLERIESQRQSAWQALDLSGLVYEVVEAQRSSAVLKQQTLILERESNMPLVEGSETQLRQAVANLVGNAIKYTPEEGRIEVHFGHLKGQLRFKVKDNGYGISPARQKRLFERFYRAQEPGTDHIAGTGLGLSLVKTVIERHGGHIWFESEPGVGSTFGFWLPVMDDEHREKTE